MSSEINHFYIDQKTRFERTFVQTFKKYFDLPDPKCLNYEKTQHLSENSILEK